MTAPAVLSGRQAAATLQRAMRLPGEAVLVGALGAALYVTVGALLVFRFGVILGDPLSRVANASHVLLSRDPHLAAVGFVWSPLPSLALIPPAVLKDVWPDLLVKGFAANLASAACMASAAVQVRGILADLGASRPARLLLTALFALHPMILYYGANGMTEAFLLFFLLLANRHLMRWLRGGDPTRLVPTGIALGLAYLCRYEAAAAGAAAILLVGAVTWTRAPRETRCVQAKADAVIVAAPILFAVAAWATASWAITGHPFEQLSSVYGNDAQVRMASADIHAATGLGTGTASSYLLDQLLGLAPLLPVVIPVALVRAVRRCRDLRPLAPLATLGAVLGFQAVAFLSGHSFGWLRFTICSVPLFVLLIGALTVQPGPPGPQAAAPARRSLLAGARLLVALILVVPCSVAGAATMAHPRLAREEAPNVRAMWRQWTSRARQDSPFEDQWAIAAYLDGLHLPSSSVLVDAAFGFPVILAAHDQRTFIITSDRDFAQAVADPARSSIRYLLVEPNAGTGRADALNRAYPSLYETGAGIATLVREFAGSGPNPTWRLYLVDPPGPDRSGS